MRIIAGTARRTRLHTVPGDRVRPTTDAMREVLFSSIAGDVPGARFLDLFAGTGAVGIEALSRGAEFAVFVDHDQRCVDTVHENLALARLEDRGEAIRRDVLQALPQVARAYESFDIVFLDPPYAYPRLEQVLRVVWDERPGITPSALVIVQHHRDQDVSVGAKPRRVKEFGDTLLSMFW
jgi:16S rRNA (guanine(966)-N(2))-methyltransferase RsmD